MTNLLIGNVKVGGIGIKVLFDTSVGFSFIADKQCRMCKNNLLQTNFDCEHSINCRLITLNV